MELLSSHKIQQTVILQKMNNNKNVTKYPMICFQQQNTVHHWAFSSQQQAEVLDHCKLQQWTNSLHNIVHLEYAGVTRHSVQPGQQVTKQLLPTKCLIYCSDHNQTLLLSLQTSRELVITGHSPQKNILPSVWKQCCNLREPLHHGLHGSASSCKSQ